MCGRARRTSRSPPRRIGSSTSARCRPAHSRACRTPRRHPWTGRPRRDQSGAPSAREHLRQPNAGGSRPLCPHSACIARSLIGRNDGTSITMTGTRTSGGIPMRFPGAGLRRSVSFCSSQPSPWRPNSRPPHTTIPLPTRNPPPTSRCVMGSSSTSRFSVRRMPRVHCPFSSSVRRTASPFARRDRRLVPGARRGGLHLRLPGHPRPVQSQGSSSCNGPRGGERAAPAIDESTDTDDSIDWMLKNIPATTAGSGCSA